MNRSVLAGIMISIGCCMYAAAENLILGSFLFSLGLMAVIQYDLPLYTGRVGLVLQNDIKTNVILITALFWNLAGVLCMWWLAHWLPVFDNVSAIGHAKLAIPLPQLFWRAVICGAFMELACNGWRRNKFIQSTKEEPFQWINQNFSKSFVTILCVMGFIIIGGEHSIADWFYLSSINFPQDSIIRMIILILGNGIGGIITNGLICSEENSIE